MVGSITLVEWESIGGSDQLIPQTMAVLPLTQELRGL